MKSMLVKQIKNEFGLRKVGGRKLELLNFYELTGILKRLKNGEQVK